MSKILNTSGEFYFAILGNIQLPLTLNLLSKVRYIYIARYCLNHRRLSAYMEEPDVRDRRIKGFSERYFMINGKAARCEICHKKIKVREVSIINGLIYHEECINNTQGNVNIEKRDVLKTMGIGAITAGASVLGIDRLASASTTISRAEGHIIRDNSFSSFSFLIQLTHCQDRSGTGWMPVSLHFLMAFRGGLSTATGTTT